jgi:methylated-DNA-[protein]-cysteine S-methyltransferase
MMREATSSAPRRRQQEEQHMGIRHAIIAQTDIPEAIGELTLVADGDDLTGIYFRGHWTRPDRSAFGPGTDAHTDPAFARAAVVLGEYLRGERTGFDGDLPMRTAGTELEERVWGILRRIPYGETTTYGSIATELGDRNLAQAVGRAVGHNPLSIVVPCHRVLGADGSLTGYAGGLERKRFLLELEGALSAAGPTLF